MALNDALNQFVNDRVGEKLLPVEVRAVDEQNLTITIKKPSGLEVPGVRLRPSTGSAGVGQVLIPQIGSYVFIVPIGKSGNQYGVVGVTQVQSVLLESSGVKVKIDSSGVLIGKGSESLASILNDLIVQIQSITVVAPNGPTSPPQNSAQFATIANRLNNLLSNE